MLWIAVCLNTNVCASRILYSLAYFSFIFLKHHVYRHMFTEDTCLKSLNGLYKGEFP